MSAVNNPFGQQFIHTSYLYQHIVSRIWLTLNTYVLTKVLNVNQILLKMCW